MDSHVALPAHVVEPQPEVVEVEAVDDEAQGMPADQSLVNRTTVRELVGVFQRAEADVRSAFTKIVEAEKALDRAFTLGSDNTFRVNPGYGGHESVDFDDADRAIERLRRQAWRVIVNRLEIRRAMSCERARQLDEHLEKGTPEPITEETVSAFVFRFAGSLDEMFEAAVVEVFEWLRPHAGTFRAENYKTNQKNGRFEVGPRLVLTGMVSLAWGNRGRFQVRYGYGNYTSPGQHLTAMWNVFSMLDGKGIGEKSYKSPLENAIETSPDGKGTTLYFDFKAHKNGTLHIHFKRADLLARFNQIAGGKRLRTEANAA